MSYFECPTCGEQHEIFGRDQARWTELLGDVPLLQRLPLLPAVAQRLTRAYLQSFQTEGGRPGSLFVALARQVATAVQGASHSHG